MAHRPRCGGTSAARTGRTYNLKLSQSGTGSSATPGKYETPSVAITTETRNKSQMMMPEPGIPGTAGGQHRPPL
jgi:hypothetical protein